MPNPTAAILITSVTNPLTIAFIIINSIIAEKKISIGIITKSPNCIILTSPLFHLLLYQQDCRLQVLKPIHSFFFEAIHFP